MNGKYKAPRFTYHSDQTLLQTVAFKMGQPASTAQWFKQVDYGLQKAACTIKVVLRT